MEQDEGSVEFLRDAVEQNRRLVGLPPQFPDVKGNSSTLFAKRSDHGRIAFECHMAIWRNHGEHVVIAAPSLEALANAWLQVVGVPLNRAIAQEVVIVSRLTTSKPDGG